jgi:hypothetical protein
MDIDPRESIVQRMRLNRFKHHEHDVSLAIFWPRRGPRDESFSFISGPYGNSWDFTGSRK